VLHWQRQSVRQITLPLDFSTVYCDTVPVPIEQVEIEHDGTEYQSSLDEKTLGILLLSREQDHLGRSNLFTRQVLDVAQKLHLVRLHTGTQKTLHS